MTGVQTCALPISGEIQCEKVFEDVGFVAILEPAPLAPGHVFVFPKQEIESWLHLEPKDLHILMNLAQKIAKAIQVVFGCPRVALAAYGLKTPHVHLHLIPVWGQPGEIDLTRTRLPASASELQENAKKIRATLLNF